MAATFKGASAEEREFWDAVYVRVLGTERCGAAAIYADQALAERRHRFGRIKDEVIAEAPTESRFERLG